MSFLTDLSAKDSNGESGLSKTFKAAVEETCSTAQQYTAFYWDQLRHGDALGRTMGAFYFATSPAALPMLAAFGAVYGGMTAFHEHASELRLKEAPLPPNLKL